MCRREMNSGIETKGSQSSGMIGRPTKMTDVKKNNLSTLDFPQVKLK